MEQKCCKNYVEIFVQVTKEIDIQMKVNWTEQVNIPELKSAVVIRTYVNIFRNKNKISLRNCKNSCEKQ
jgi:hypothetical protein